MTMADGLVGLEGLAGREFFGALGDVGRADEAVEIFCVGGHKFLTTKDTKYTKTQGILFRVFGVVRGELRVEAVGGDLGGEFEIGNPDAGDGVGAIVGSEKGGGRWLPLWLTPAKGAALLAPVSCWFQLMRPAARSPERLNLWRDLTPREREIALLGCEGHRNAEVAKRLSKSVLTNKTQLNSVFGNSGSSRGRS
jgi:DNA-binding CsgD family transcriptional regulator